MLAMPPRDGDVLMESGRHLVARGIEPPRCIGDRAKLALRKSRAAARMHANCSVVSDPPQTITATRVHGDRLICGIEARGPAEETAMTVEAVVYAGGVLLISFVIWQTHRVNVGRLSETRRGG
jgi:hypothetical protein